MSISQIHHVTLIVDALDAACDFYEEVFGLELINMVNLDFPAQFYRIGENQQLHITEWPDAHSFRGHVCFQVDDFMSVFRKAQALGAIDTRPWGKARILPNGAVQMFLRDPSGNLLEISCKAGTPLDRDVLSSALFEPEPGLYVSGRNDPRGRRRAKTAAEAEAVNTSS
jgi:catechol 2,3-dioxygenase-like lactoylglutathione lyase family enzyme